MLEVIIIIFLFAIAGGALLIVVQQQIARVRTSPLKKFLLEQTKLESQSDIKDGLLSLTHGFLPSTPPLLSLPESHKAWDDIAEKIPTLLKKYQLKKAVESLPTLPATKTFLEDKYLGRASVILSALAHAYCFQEGRMRLPDSIEIPWQEVSTRLSRQGPMRTATDDFLYNWKFINQELENPMQLDNLEQLVPFFHEPEDRIVGLIVTLCEHAFAPAFAAICDVHDGCLNNNTQQILAGLKVLTQVVKNITSIYSQISPNPHAKFYVDPSVWAKTFALIGNSAHEGELGNSGINSPLFHVLDAFISRKSFTSNLGIQMQERAKYFPENYHSLIKLINAFSVADYIEKSPDRKTLHPAFQEFINGYTGPKGFFAVHARIAVSYVKLATELGRTETNNEVITGNSFGCPVQHKWQKINNDIVNGLQERKGDSCPFSMKMTTAENQGVNASSYTRIDVMMRNNPEKSLWCVNNDKVFNLTAILDKHPGGDSIIISDAGLDMTNTFSAIHRMQPHLIKKYYVGEISLFLPNKEAQKLGDALEKLTKLENIIRNNFGYRSTHRKVSFRIMEPSLVTMFVKEPAAIKAVINEVFVWAKLEKKLPDFPDVAESFTSFLEMIKSQPQIEELGNSFLQTRKEALLKLSADVRKYIYSFIKMQHLDLSSFNGFNHLADKLNTTFASYEKGLNDQLSTPQQEVCDAKPFFKNSIM